MTTTITPPPQWSRRRAEKARRIDQVRSITDDVIIPSDKIVAALEALIAPGDRVVLEGNNQKQADFLSRSLAQLSANDHLADFKPDFQTEETTS